MWYPDRSNPRVAAAAARESRSGAALRRGGDRARILPLRHPPPPLAPPAGRSGPTDAAGVDPHGVERRESAMGPTPEPHLPAAGVPTPQEERAERSREDALLATRAAAGDATAFHLLLERYHRLLFKVSRRKAGNDADAEDIVQDICLHAWRSLPKLRDPQAFLGWLLAIAQNRANRFCDRRRRKVVVLDEARHTLEERERARAERAEAEEDGGELVRRLPDEMRLALTWKYLDGCSYEEIGERLDLSFHQVDYLLRRAKAALRREVERADDPAEGGHAG